MATSTTSKKDAPTVEDLAAQLDTLRGDISHLTGLLGDYGRDRVEQAGKSAKQHAADFRARAETDVDRLRSRAGDLAGDAENFMHERPATAIGIAVGLGFLVGLATSRR